RQLSCTLVVIRGEDVIRSRNVTGVQTCALPILVKGAHADEQKERTYLYQGIAERNFERKFQLAENIHVRGANLVNGLLYIDLERVIPEAKKPRRIEIN